MLRQHIACHPQGALMILTKITKNMNGATIKIVNAQQARLNNIYKNTKLKLLKVNAAIR